MSDTPQSLRRNYLKYPFVNRRLQFSIGILFMGISLLSTFYIGLILILFAGELTERFQTLQVDAAMVALFQTEVHRLLTISILYIGVTLSFFCLLFGLFFSHRIAGPIHAIKLRMRAMAKRSDATPVRLRKGDYLADLADDTNVLIQTLNEHQSIISEAKIKIEEGDTRAANDMLDRLVTQNEHGATG